jgi:glycosyltransferase involved in cell wall biosynthesis
VFECIRSTHTLELITLGAEKSLGGVNYSSWTAKFNYRFRIPFRALCNLRNYEYLVVGGWDSIGYVVIIIMAKFFRIPHSMLFESTLESRKYNKGLFSFLRKTIFRKVSTILALSELSYEAAVTYCGDKRKIIKSKNWFDPTYFRFKEDSELNVGYSFIYLGRLIPQKGIERMIKAFYEVADLSDLLYIVGEGPERDRLQGYCLDERVRFIGLVEHYKLEHFLNMSQALIFPSLNDVYGFPCLEALSCGLGVVVSKQAGIWKDIYTLPGVIVFEDDLVGALSQIKTIKKSRQSVDISEFHYTTVLETLRVSYEQSKNLIAS